MISPHYVNVGIADFVGVIIQSYTDVNHSQFERSPHLRFCTLVCSRNLEFLFIELNKHEKIITSTQSYFVEFFLSHGSAAPKHNPLLPLYRR